MPLDDQIFRVYYENVKRVFFSTDDFFILVDGLSLVLEACLNQHLQWTSNGVCLHAIYCVERLIRMLLKLKSNLKFAFFHQIDSIIERCESQTGRNQFDLIYQLVVFHLKSIEALKDRLVFYSSFSDYTSQLKNDRIICFMCFSYVDTKLVSNAYLARELKDHFVRVIYSTLDIGVKVIFTKNFWFVIIC